VGCISQLKEENQNLSDESKILKDLLIEDTKKNYKILLTKAGKSNNSHTNSKNQKHFYIQIILGIFVIVLSLGFHILYLAITDCLLYNGGNSGCWIINWLGIDIHGSFFLDITLYSLIAIQCLLIILIIRNQLAKV
ncbi:MAG: hypothetical protein ACFFG0_21030, partial [Candidatus Thorarchaeota archaeon]